MKQEVCQEWAYAAAAQIINLHMHSDEEVTLKYVKIASLITDAIKLAVMEERQKLLLPSEN